MIGITWQKAGYIHDLAVSIRAGELDVDALAGEPPEQARASLLEMRGIGPWTADAYLLSALRLPDVFPIGDRALQVGMTELLGMTRLLFPDDMEFLSRPWRPLRAVAARIIWHAYLSNRGRVEPPDPTASVERRDVGRLGVFLITQLADRFDYARAGECNRVTVELPAAKTA